MINIIEYLGTELAALTPMHVVYMGTMSFPFVFYTFAWIFPKPWAALSATLFRQHPIDAVATVCYVAKVLQGVMTLYFFDFSLDGFTLSTLLFAAVCVGAGQFLNSRVYKLLGHDGIFYGVRFGAVIPWVYDFPYSHIRDPQ